MLRIGMRVLECARLCVCAWQGQAQAQGYLSFRQRGQPTSSRAAAWPTFTTGLQAAQSLSWEQCWVQRCGRAPPANHVRRILELRKDHGQLHVWAVARKGLVECAVKGSCHLQVLALAPPLEADPRPRPRSPPARRPLLWQS